MFDTFIFDGSCMFDKGIVLCIWRGYLIWLLFIIYLSKLVMCEICSCIGYGESVCLVGC